MERKVMCKNVGVCSKANKIQIITDDDAELICPECGEPVELVKDEPQPEALKGSKKKMFACIAVAILAIAIIIGCVIAFSGGKETPKGKEDAGVVKDSTKVVTPPVADSVNVKTDTVVVRDTIVKNNTTTISEKTSTKTVVSTTSPVRSSQPANTSGSGTLRLSYGTYTGATKNGYPHGQGRLTYTTTRQINRNDAKGRTANAGDYVIGEFYNGFVVYGKHYDSAGNLLGSLNIGVGNETSYESK